MVHGGNLCAGINRIFISEKIQTEVVVTHVLCILDNDVTLLNVHYGASIIMFYTCT